MRNFILIVINVRKGNIDDIYDSEKNRFEQSPDFLIFNTLNPDTYKDWTKEDFLYAIRLGDEIKKHSISPRNDIIANDNSHCGLRKSDIFQTKSKSDSKK